MRELVGVIHGFDLDDIASIKQEALLFNRIGVMSLSKPANFERD
jgi:hypothetical protein